MVYYNHVVYNLNHRAERRGAGKTTLALTLAVAVEQTSRTTVVLDTDSQATACKWSAWRAAETPLVLAVQPDRLQSALATAAAHGVDMVVIDTPPGPSSRRWKRLVSPIWWLFPAAHNATTLRRSPRTQQVLSLAGGVSAVVVLSAVAPRGPRTDQARAALTGYGLRVCPATLGSRAAVGDAGALGVTAIEFQPRGRAAKEARAVAQWITEILETGGPPDA